MGDCLCGGVVVIYSFSCQVVCIPTEMSTDIETLLNLYIHPMRNSYSARFTVVNTEALRVTCRHPNHQVEMTGPTLLRSTTDPV